jgi:hypothetical protein
MTTQILGARDVQARSVIDSVLSAELAALSPKSIVVTPRDNHSGEPALYVYVVVASAQDIPGEPEQNRLVGQLISALAQIGDSRFPYLYFGSRSLDEGGWIGPQAEDEEA